MGHVGREQRLNERLDPGFRSESIRESRESKQ